MSLLLLLRGAGGPASLVATAADTVGSLTDAPTRLFIGTRSDADSIGSLSEVANRLGVKARTAADSLGSLSEVVARAVMAKARTAGD
jgi:hypothetical protein